MSNQKEISDSNRRKILKTAMVAAPMVATLNSGSVFAATSFIQCSTNTDNNVLPETIDKITPTMDEWVRIIGMKRLAPDETTWIYRIDDMGAINWLIESSTGKLTVISPNEKPEWWDAAAYSEKEFYTLTYFYTNDGTRLGPYPLQNDEVMGNGVSALNASCLTSFAAATSTQWK